jgi:hypothetical protein
MLVFYVQIMVPEVVLVWMAVLHLLILDHIVMVEVLLDVAVRIINGIVFVIIIKLGVPLM